VRNPGARNRTDHWMVETVLVWQRTLTPRKRLHMRRKRRYDKASAVVLRNRLRAMAWLREYRL
jgi:hypothetical protein